MSRVVMLMVGVHNPMCVGAIYTSLTREELAELWDKWRDEFPEPDADNEFVDWAIKNNFNCSAVSFSNFEFVTIEE